jgi:hypothetical protein
MSHTLLAGRVPLGADFGWWIEGLVTAYILGGVPVVVIAILVGSAAHKYPRFNAMTYSVLLFVTGHLGVAVLWDIGQMRDPDFTRYFLTESAFWIHVPAIIVGLICAYVSYPRKSPSINDLADRFS